MDVQRSRQTKGRAQVYLRGHESSDGPSHELTAAIVRERETALSLQQQNNRWGTRVEWGRHPCRASEGSWSVWRFGWWNGINGLNLNFVSRVNTRVILLTFIIFSSTSWCTSRKKTAFVTSFVCYVHENVDPKPQRMGVLDSIFFVKQNRSRISLLFSDWHLIFVYEKSNFNFS